MKKVEFQKLHFGTVKWDDMFDSVDELIRTMTIVSPRFEKNGYKGYAYVNSFTKYYSENKELTLKQITQLKRISKEIYKCYFNM